jgi:thiol-disulfide isomerase/thioredoxin
MRTGLGAAALALTAALALSACSTGTGDVAPMSAGANGVVNGNATTKIIAVGDRTAAPAVTGDELGGATFDLSAQRGHVVVVNFWGSWCPPCRVEAADLQNAYTATGAVFIGINVRDDRDAAVAYEKAHAITYPSIFDPAGRIALAFHSFPPSSIPSTIVIDANGRVAGIHIGSITQAQLTDMITKATV